MFRCHARGNWHQKWLEGKIIQKCAIKRKRNVIDSFFQVYVSNLLYNDNSMIARCASVIVDYWYRNAQPTRKVTVTFPDPEGSRGANDPSSQTQAALDNKHNMEQREQYYATVRKPGQQSPCREVSALERIPEYSEDIYPYATFNLPEQENLSANPMRQAFFYERSETMLQGAQVRLLFTTVYRRLVQSILQCFWHRFFA